MPYSTTSSDTKRTNGRGKQRAASAGAERFGRLSRARGHLANRTALGRIGDSFTGRSSALEGCAVKRSKQPIVSWKSASVKITSTWRSIVCLGGGRSTLPVYRTLLTFAF